ncbi:patatin-like phospholipase family protein [Myxococcota bacterium]|nr:patatin-like phospholipase family protein [Myxococcota bacterium]
MFEAPVDIRPDLAERYRQLRPFDEAETVLVRALVRRPDRLPRPQEIILRQALNLARLWVVPGSAGDVVVGPQLGALRDRIRPLAERIATSTDLDVLTLGPDAHQILPLLVDARESLLAAYGGRLLASHLDKELGEKALVVVTGGGGGCGYVHLGAFSLFESLGLTPKLIAGASMGSILGLFRAREARFRDATIRAVTHGLTFPKLFRVLDAETRYSMPGTLRLYLRSALSRFFVNDAGETMRMREMDVPFVCVVTGVRREAARGLGKYEHMFQKAMRRGALGRLLHIKDLVQHMASFMAELMATPGALRPIPLGSDDETREFDVLDAVGFSSAVPAVIQYDVTRDDPRMHSLIQATLKRHDVDHFADGGLASNVPARFAWEHVQTGQIGTRNATIFGLDCFAPQIARNMLFIPIQRLAAENVAKDRLFAQLWLTYKQVLSPTSLVPKQHAVDLAVEHGREEVAREAPVLQKMLERLPPIGTAQGA